MDAQRTPDLLTSDEAENHLICEKLLGWEKVLVGTDNYPAFKRTPHEDPIYAPSFTTWADAGLILDAFEGRAPIERVDSDNYKSAAGEQLKKLGIVLSRGELRPAQIRAAALEYIRSLP